MAQDDPERQSIEDILGKQSSSRSASPKRTDEPSPPPAPGGGDGAGRRPGEAEGERPSQRGTNLTVAALVCGGLGIVAAVLIPIVGLLLGIAAIILAVLDRRAGRSDGRTTAGLALGGLVIVISIASFAIAVSSNDDKDKKDSDKKENKDKKDSDGKDTKKDGK